MVGVFLFSFGYEAHAANQVFYQGVGYPTMSAAQAAHNDALHQNSCRFFTGSVGQTQSLTYNGIVGPVHQYTHIAECSHDPALYSDIQNLTIAADGNECDAPDVFNPATGTCEVGSTCDDSITGQAFIRPIYSANDQGEICHESSQCKMVVDDITMLSSNAGLVSYSGTNQNCTTEPEVPMTAANQEENCISSGTDTFCTEPDLADQNCGMLNGEYICLDAVPDGDCTFYGNGNMACSTNAGSPPAPDDGVTAGVPATPDSTIESNGTTINNYNNSTVNNSSGATSGSSQGDAPNQQEIDLDFSDIIEQEPDSGTYVIPIDAVSDQTGQELDDVITDIGDGTGFAVPNTVGDSWTSIFGYTYSCSDINLFIAGQNITLECAELADLRSVLAWIANVIFFLGVFQLLMRGPE